MGKINMPDWITHFEGVNNEIIVHTFSEDAMVISNLKEDTCIITYKDEVKDTSKLSEYATDEYLKKLISIAESIKK